MNWCCPVFKDYVSVAGERGYAILINKFEEKSLLFILQHRSIDPGKESLVTSSTPLSLETNAHIAFCPWCGTDLHAFYEKQDVAGNGGSDSNA